MNPGSPTVLSRRRFDVDEYHRMIEAGILSEDDRVELLDGEIVQMHSIGSRHFASVIQIGNLLIPQLSGSALVSIRGPVRLSRFSEPEPDVALLRVRDDCYASGLPEPADTYLIVEVADSSLLKDRTAKLPLYAVAQIPELWIVDLTANAVDVHRDPEGHGYATVTRFAEGVVTPLAFPDLRLDVREILPNR